MPFWLIILTIVLPWSGAIIVWSVGDHRPQIQHRLALLFSGLAGLCALLLIPLTSDAAAIRLPFGAAAFGDLTFIPDSLGVLLAVIATVIGSLTVLFSNGYMQGEKSLGRYYALVLLFIGSMVGLVLSGSLFFLFLFWEMTALCSYALIAFHSDNPQAVRGGMTALLITQLGGVGLLAGVLAIYAWLGSFDIPTFLAEGGSLPGPVLAAVGFTFLLAAATKSAQFPFHTWLPGAMEAPTPVSALIHAATMVNAGVYLLVRFYPTLAGIPGWTTAVILIGLITALIGSLMALTTYDLKRTLAYSTISQLGVMVVAVGVGGIFASQFHLASHALFKALLFLGAGAVIHQVGTRDMRQMGGLWRTMPLVANCFVIGAAALAGVPLLNGFWSKELILETALHNGYPWVYLTLVLTAGLTAAYAVRMVWWVFVGWRTEQFQLLDPGFQVAQFKGIGEALDPVTDSPAPATVHSGSPHPSPQLPFHAPLVILALGTLLSWLIAGEMGHWLAQTLPFHNLHVLPTLELVAEITLNEATLLALMVTAAGMVIWWWRGRILWVWYWFRPLRQAARHDFGFTWLNDRIVTDVKGFAAAWQLTQTGQLNWNMAGIVMALLVILLIIFNW